MPDKTPIARPEYMPREAERRKLLAEARQRVKDFRKDELDRLREAYPTHEFQDDDL